MLKIGTFSKLCRVPIKTLRYYDEIGLLAPMQIDPSTGYRLYAIEQVQRLNRILVLKDLGFNLEQIRIMLDEPLSPEALRGMLRLRQAEAARQLESTQTRLDRIAYRLRLIEQENQMPDYEVVLKTSGPMRVAALRRILPEYGHFGELYQALTNALARAGVAPAGPAISIGHDEEYKESEVDMEAAVEIEEGAGPAGTELATRTLPAEMVAATIHRGAYNELSAAYTALMAWIRANGYQACGPNREIYLQGPGEGRVPEDTITEIQIPVRKNEP